MYPPLPFPFFAKRGQFFLQFFGQVFTLPTIWNKSKLGWDPPLWIETQKTWITDDDLGFPHQPPLNKKKTAFCPSRGGGVRLMPSPRQMITFCLILNAPSSLVPSKIAIFGALPCLKGGRPKKPLRVLLSDGIFFKSNIAYQGLK